LGYELVAVVYENDSEATGTEDVGNFLSSRAIGRLVTITTVIDCGHHICHLKKRVRTPYVARRENLLAQLVVRISSDLYFKSIVGLCPSSGAVISLSSINQFLFVMMMHVYSVRKGRLVLK
jgi:hypothetical protein